MFSLPEIAVGKRTFEGIPDKRIVLSEVKNISALRDSEVDSEIIVLNLMVIISSK